MVGHNLVTYLTYPGPPPLYGIHSVIHVFIDILYARSDKYIIEIIIIYVIV